MIVSSKMERKHIDEAKNRLIESLECHNRIQRDSTIEAISRVPRHKFVPENRQRVAYKDEPLPIGDGQTISRPQIVAIILDKLNLEPGNRILEIGTGCGYHAATTAEIVGGENVYSVEYSSELAEDTRDRLNQLGYEGIDIRIGDGFKGWQNNSPYDAAYFTCAAPQFPAEVIQQVRTGGKILAPIGNSRQRLVMAQRQSNGKLETEELGGVRFVRMRGHQS